MTPARCEWDAATGPGRLVAALAETGLAWVRAPALVEAAEREPWAAAERLLGERPLLVERQPIRCVPGGRSFASGRMAAPFHSDSQLLRGVPPHVQVMACHRAAEAGGEGLYLDTWALLTRVEREEPALFARLFTTLRRIPFVFGDVFGPTVSQRGDSLVFTHGARPLPDDPVATRLRPHVEGTPVMEVRAAAGDLVLIHNHRVLHGRRAFEDDGRAFTRLLVWRHRPWPAPRPWRERAAAEARALSERLREAPAAIRAGFGLAEPTPTDVGRRLGIVLELLRGVPAGMLSAREGVSEPELYGWRDAVLDGATENAASPAAGRPPEAELEDWRRRLS
jgi:gamma-butyrobetaine dioxygenase